MSEVQSTIELDEDTVINTKTMALTLGVTTRRVQQMIQDGTLKTCAKGKLLLFENVQRYISFITSNQMTEEERKLENARKSAEFKLKAAKAEIAMLEASELKGKMHRSEDVEALTQDLCSYIREGFLSLPGRLAVDVALSETAEECSVLIRDAVYTVLDGLSDYEYAPAKYEERVRNRESMDERPDEDE